MSAPGDALSSDDGDVSLDGEVPSDDGLSGDEAESELTAFDRIREWGVVLVGALVVAVLLRTFVVQVFFIPSVSMEHTLLIDDRVVADKVTYHLTGIEPGDVVVFRRPEGVAGDTDDLIKRVVAVSGQTVEIRRDTLMVDGEPRDEPYVDDGTLMGDFGPVEVPAGHLFVMGDNRDESTDSRVFGPIDENLVVGRAEALIWPFDRLRGL